MNKKVFLIPLTCISGIAMADTDIDQHIQAFSKAKENLKTDTVINLDNQYQLSTIENNNVNAINDHINSDEWNNKIDEIKGRIYLDVTDEKSRWKSLEQLKDNNDEVVPFSDKPILFISSSIPQHVLRTYAKDLEKQNGVMILRGIIGGIKYFKPTAEFIADFLKKSPHCKDSPSKMCERYKVNVIIDPILFREYNIDKVPAFTIHGKENFTAYCQKDTPLNKASFVSYGDYSIKYHIHNFNEKTKNNEK